MDFLMLQLCCSFLLKNVIFTVIAGPYLIETVEGQIPTAFASTNLFFFVKYKPLSTRSIEIENELWLGF